MIWEWPCSLEFLDIISPHTSQITSLALEFFDTHNFGSFITPWDLGRCRWGSLKYVSLIECGDQTSVDSWQIPLSGTPTGFLSSLQLDELVFEVTIDGDVYGWLGSPAFENIVTLIVHTGMDYLYFITW
jgi:hypothetical protein